MLIFETLGKNARLLSPSYHDAAAFTARSRVVEVFDVSAEHRAGKRTLSAERGEGEACFEITARELANARKDMNLSRCLSAGYVLANKRALENWEQDPQSQVPNPC